MTRILIIEDERDLADLVAFNLEQEGYETTLAHDGLRGFDQARRDSPDLILLDLMLPGLNGVEVCKMIRNHQATSQIPVIMVTAKGEEIDKVVGFEVGADDYLVKPFSNRELLLRIKALLRRIATASPESTTMRVGPVAIDTVRHKVTVFDVEVALTTIEFKLLVALADTGGRVLNREHLLSRVWGYSDNADTRTVDTHITRLRTKLTEAGVMIRTVRGFGYKMEA